MSTRSLLPTHQRNSSGIIILGPPSSRSILRMKEKYFFFGVIVSFMFFCFIGMIYLPDLKSTQLYNRYIKPADSLGPNLLGLVPPIESHGHNSNNEDNYELAVLPRPRARFDDERRLRKKIEEHFNISQEAVIPIPNLNPKIRSHINLDVSQSSRITNATIDLPDGADPDPDIAKKRDFIKNMTIISWDNYKKYAWGENELRPVSKRGHSSSIFGTSKLGMTKSF